MPCRLSQSAAQGIRRLIVLDIVPHNHENLFRRHRFPPFSQTRELPRQNHVSVLPRCGVSSTVSDDYLLLVLPERVWVAPRSCGPELPASQTATVASANSFSPPL